MFMEDLPVFGPLDRGQLLQLSRLARTSSHTAGSVIYKQGADGDDLFLIR